MTRREELEALHKAATPGPWSFRSGNDAHGDSVDLLMAEIGGDEDEDPDYVEVLFGQELSDYERSANWELTQKLRNALPAILAIWEAAEKYVRAKCAYEPTESLEFELRSALADAEKRQ